MGATVKPAAAQQRPHYARLPRQARELPRHSALLAAPSGDPSARGRTCRSRGGVRRGDPRPRRALAGAAVANVRERDWRLLISCIFRGSNRFASPHNEC